MSEVPTIRITANGEPKMALLASLIAPYLSAGDILLLRGDLGAGKTTLTRNLAAALESPSAVSSPTFSLIHVYKGGRLPIIHVDAYRLRGPADFSSIGLDEYIDAADSVVIVEWPERIEQYLPVDRLEISIEEAGDDARELTISLAGRRWENTSKTLLAALSQC